MDKMLQALLPINKVTSLGAYDALRPEPGALVSL
jgi:hypothetical protein